jgi:hypothetical protein
MHKMDLYYFLKFLSRRFFALSRKEKRGKNKQFQTIVIKNVFLIENPVFFYFKYEKHIQKRNATSEGKMHIYIYIYISRDGRSDQIRLLNYINNL